MKDSKLNTQTRSNRYFAVSDVHSYFTCLKQTLERQGFSVTDPTHVLMVLGDAFDRGTETRELAEFLLDLHDAGRLLYIRGNHEDLLVMLLQQLARGYDPIDLALGVHASNGTWQTALDLADMTEAQALRAPLELVARVKETRVYRDLLPSCLNYWETDEYVFVHGWIPTKADGRGRSARHEYDPLWREADEPQWKDARWINGMDAACRQGVLEPNKTIVCGHYHTSWGHCHIDGRGNEWGEDALFSPFTASGILAIDACTAYSKTMNCFVLDHGRGEENNCE